MQAFRSGKLKTLIATDISARGIDIPNVDWVINYDLPESSEQYVHRVGRTGRGDQKGQALSFCSEEEKELLEEIESNLGKPIQELSISKSDYQFTKEIVVDTKETDWQGLMDNAEVEEEQWKKIKKKRSKK
jgi:ATP-dependent RNA helicase RhlE